MRNEALLEEKSECDSSDAQYVTSPTKSMEANPREKEIELRGSAVMGVAEHGEKAPGVGQAEPARYQICPQQRQQAARVETYPTR